MKLRLTSVIAIILTVVCFVPVMAGIPQTQTSDDDSVWKIEVVESQTQTAPQTQSGLAWDKLTWEEIGKLLVACVNTLQEKETMSGCWPESAMIQVGTNEEIIVMVVAVLKNNGEFRNVPIYLLERKNWHPRNTFAEIKKSAEAYDGFREQVREAQANGKLYSPEQSEFVCSKEEESLIVGLQNALQVMTETDQAETAKWRQLEPRVTGLTFITLLLDGERRFMVHVSILNQWGLEDNWLAATYSLGELQRKGAKAVMAEIRRKIIEFLARKDYLQKPEIF